MSGGRRYYTEAELQAAIITARAEGAAAARDFVLHVLEHPESQGREKLAILIAVKHSHLCASSADAIALLQAAGREQPRLAVVVDNSRSA